MSLGYAERLSFREDLGGRLGDPEILENSREVLRKVEQLTELVRSAQRVVAFTGAGISTACGIPDFRGPNGVWTLQRAGKPLPKAKVSFLYAQPSLTHMALLGLMQAGKLAYVCSQNVDSLHLRSGVPRSQLAELHGNCFAERCRRCKAEYVRDFEMDTVGFKPTGRACTRPGCSGQLVDHILDWEDALPPAELKATETHASAAGVSMCLGTSLQIIPAANLPLRTVKSGGHLAIINLQGTPKDKKATVVIHAKVDQVMATLMKWLGVPIPTYVRTDRLLLSHKAARHTPAANNHSNGSQLQPEQPQQQQEHDDSSSWGFVLTLASVHGEECPLPMVASASVSFYDEAELAARAASKLLPQQANGAAAAAAVDAAAAAAAPAQPGPVDTEGLQQVLPRAELSGPVPWRVERQAGCCPGSLQAVAAVVRLQLVDAADEGLRQQQLHHYTIKQPSSAAQPPAAAAAAAATPAAKSGRGTRSASAKQRQQEQQPDSSEVVAFVTQVRDYSAEQQELVAALHQAAGVSEQQHVDGQQQQLQPAVAAAAAAAAAGGQEEAAGAEEGSVPGDHDAARPAKRPKQEEESGDGGGAAP